MEGGKGKVGAHVSKAQGLKCSGLSPQPCNTEGIKNMTHKQTDKQINRQTIHALL